MQPDEGVTLARSSARSAARATAGPALALFASAGRLSFWQAWAYLGITLLATLLTNRYLLRHDRALLRRRLALEEYGERDPAQKLLVLLMVVFGLVLYIVAGLDQRFAWSQVPWWGQLLGFVLLVVGLVLVFMTFRANSFASSVIAVEAQQTVARKGPYRAVRHPMYTGILLGTAATPLCLGSYVAELLLVPIVIVFVVRLTAEERYLAQHLPGYTRYIRETPKRLLPGLW